MRLSAPETNILKPFTLMAHNPDYILLAAYNFHGWSSQEFEEITGKDFIDLDDVEA